MGPFIQINILQGTLVMFLFCHMELDLMIYTHSELHFTKMSALGTVYTLSAKSLTARFKILQLYFTVTVTYECRNFETLKEKALKSGTVRLWFELCKTKH